MKTKNDDAEMERAFSRMAACDEASRLICQGRSLRFAALTLGLSPTTLGRWLAIQRQADDAAYSASCAARADDPDDVPF